ncbi:hypothetical protein CHISP_2486 [Chitinispirillum alkaliphilum]|nr:hypothetical protein CHISP_2486 [Chitinispirillum alkaliphilum]
MIRRLTVITILCFTVLVSANTNFASAIAIDPVIDSIDSELSFSRFRKFFIGTVVNASDMSDSAVVGYTRIRRNLQAPLVSVPEPDIAVKRSLTNIFTSREIIAEDISSADFIVDVTIIKFQLNEEPKFLHRVMGSNIKMEIKIINPSDKTVLHTFIIESYNERAAINTTRHAETILQDGIREVVKQILRRVTEL